MSSLIPHDYRYKISSPTPVDKEPLKKDTNESKKQPPKGLLLLIFIKTLIFLNAKFDLHTLEWYDLMRIYQNVQY